jgi:hypothetical protein
MVSNKTQGQHSPFTFCCHVLWIGLYWFGIGERYWGIVILLALHNLNLTLFFCWEEGFPTIVSSRLVLCISLQNFLGGSSQSDKIYNIHL